MAGAEKRSPIERNPCEQTTHLRGTPKRPLNNDTSFVRSYCRFGAYRDGQDLPVKLALKYGLKSRPRYVRDKLELLRHL